MTLTLLAFIVVDKVVAPMTEVNNKESALRPKISSLLIPGSLKRVLSEY